MSNVQNDTVQVRIAGGRSLGEHVDHLMSLLAQAGNDPKRREAVAHEWAEAASKRLMSPEKAHVLSAAVLIVSEDPRLR